MTSDSENFESFKNSFSYGTRTDLNFKFLKGLTEEEAARFFQDLLWKLGDTINDGQAQRLIDHVYQWQSRSYGKSATSWQYDDAPFSRLSKPLAQARLGLLTSTGHFEADDDPEPFGVIQMSQEEAIERLDEFLRDQPSLSRISRDIAQDRLKVRHPGYDIRGVETDPNVAFPIHRLQELAEEGVVGELAHPVYSFVGATAQGRLMRHSMPEWRPLFAEAGLDALLLIPV